MWPTRSLIPNAKRMENISTGLTGMDSMPQRTHGSQRNKYLRTLLSNTGNERDSAQGVPIKKGGGNNETSRQELTTNNSDTP